MKKVNVIDINDDASNDDFRYPGTYLHGELEDEIGYDIFAFDRKTEFVEGVNDVLVEESQREATFFLWANEGTFQLWRGYLVYNDDAQYERCKRAFINRDSHI